MKNVSSKFIVFILKMRECRNVSKIYNLQTILFAYYNERRVLT